jgi:hypothetical protein
MRHLTLCTALIGAALLAGCSINVPRHPDEDDYTPMSCSVKCPAKGRSSASCVEPRIPACSCEPNPSASCVEPRAGK